MKKKNFLVHETVHPLGKPDNNKRLHGYVIRDGSPPSSHIGLLYRAAMKKIALM